MEPTRMVIGLARKVGTDGGDQGVGVGSRHPVDRGDDVAHGQGPVAGSARFEPVDGGTSVVLGDGVAQLAQRHRFGRHLRFGHVHGSLGVEFRLGQVAGQVHRLDQGGVAVQPGRQQRDQVQVLDEPHIGEQNLPVEPMASARAAR